MHNLLHMIRGVPGQVFAHSQDVTSLTFPSYVDAVIYSFKNLLLCKLESSNETFILHQTDALLDLLGHGVPCLRKALAGVLNLRRVGSLLDSGEALVHGCVDLAGLFSQDGCGANYIVILLDEISIWYVKQLIWQWKTLLRSSQYLVPKTKPSLYFLREFWLDTLRLYGVLFHKGRLTLLSSTKSISWPPSANFATTGCTFLLYSFSQFSTCGFKLAGTYFFAVP